MRGHGLISSGPA